MAFRFSVLLICLFGFGGVDGHMGISDLRVDGGAGGIEPREKASVNDAYRYPNAGHCHGVQPIASQTSVAVGDNIKLTLSSGAAHNGGHCALFLAKKTDDEAVWYKQMDNIDCTNKASFNWLIVAELVPAECNTAAGCSLIWVWTPRSSGACEIYMNCWNLQITGSNGGASPAAAHTVNKNPVCARVDPSTKQTPTYGTFCGVACNKGGGTVVVAPTPSPTAPGATSSPTGVAAPTKSSTCNNCRCGSSWIEANSACKSLCTVDSESTQCFGGDKCWADMLRLCEQPQTTDTSITVTTSNCAAIGVWAGMPSIDAWCASVCPSPCPSSHCQCTAGEAKYVDSSVQVYVPSCQEYVVQAQENISISSISHIYDLSSYQLDQNNADAKAANELLAYNKGCNPALAGATTTSSLPQGTTIFITGDCQMTDKCPFSAATKKFVFSSTMVALLGMWFIASL